MADNESPVNESNSESEETPNLTTINAYMKAILSESKRNSSAISKLGKKYGNLKREICKRKLSSSSDSDEVENTTKTVYLNNPQARKKAKKGSTLVKNPGFVKNSLGTQRKDTLSENLVAEPNGDENITELTNQASATKRKVPLVTEELEADPDALILT